MSAQLSVCIFSRSEFLTQSCEQILSKDRYDLTEINSTTEFLGFVEQQKHQLDCLLLEADQELLPSLKQLYAQRMLLPAVIIQQDVKITGNLQTPVTVTNNSSVDEKLMTIGNYFYHPAEVVLPATKLNQMTLLIDQAIAEFLKPSPNNYSLDSAKFSPKRETPDHLDFDIQQRRRLAEKLKERLGYLAVYYKRSPQNFFRNLSPNEKTLFLDNLKSKYCEIILTYFDNDPKLNQEIDDFVNLGFFADLSVSQIVEIHMELMEQFSQQLKIEGRSEEILLDYRITLIDIISHLCEMYRRSLPKEL
ncbi:KaiA family protein [Crinalium epipsammum PCC 9333]|uniref:Circadian clock oscillator protein KaiA n=1 Tax=Crinalium epipsammum PCC 9333 TaxID=1173022 RepID=K9VYJ2_9CYAN|nr:circadian clock protein KaiA [Crinalium epipsammum]AFZ12562.1 KaiA family protein [Crinalium epipsammum PCC 9333]